MANVLNFFEQSLVGGDNPLRLDGTVTVKGEPIGVGFNYVNTIFVAKGGDDSNSGTSLGSPKLTFSGALDALSGATEPSLIRGMDSGEYIESLLLDNPNIIIDAPTATLTRTGGFDPLTIDGSVGVRFGFIKMLDAGFPTAVPLRVTSNGGGLVIATLQGVVNAVVIDTAFIVLEGGALQGGINLVNNATISLNITARDGFDATDFTNGTAGLTGQFGDTFFNRHSFYVAENRTGNFSVTSEDSGQIVGITDGNNQITCPDDAGEAVPIGFMSQFLNRSATSFDFVPGGSATIEGANALPAGIRVPSDEGVTLYKIAADTWFVKGNTAGIP